MSPGRAAERGNRAGDGGRYTDVAPIRDKAEQQGDGPLIADLLPLPHPGQVRKEAREHRKQVARFLAVILGEPRAAKPSAENGLNGEAR